MLLNSVFNNFFSSDLYNMEEVNSHNLRYLGKRTNTVCPIKPWGGCATSRNISEDYEDDDDQLAEL